MILAANHENIEDPSGMAASEHSASKPQPKIHHEGRVCGLSKGKSLNSSFLF
jgi:hypothetical protein